MKLQLFFTRILFLCCSFGFGSLYAQFDNGATVTEKQLIDKAWHISNKEGNKPLVGIVNGLPQTNGFSESDANTFVIIDGPNDGSGWTADERWFLIRSLTTGTYLTANGTAAGSSVTLGNLLPESGDEIYKQMFRLIPAPSGSGWYKLRCRVSQNGPDRLLELKSDGTLMIDAPKAGEAAEQKFAFNLQLPNNSGTRYVVIGAQNAHFMSDNGIITPATPAVHIRHSNPSVVWNLIPAGSGYYYLYNELTQHYMYDEGGSEMKMGAATGDPAMWEINRSDQMVKFKNKNTGHFIGTAGFTADGQTLRTEPGTGIGVRWGIYRVDAPEFTPSPGNYERISDAPDNPNCVSYGVNFKRALAERVGLTPNENYFPFIVSAVAFSVGLDEADNLMRKFDLNNPGHRVDLALMVRKYMIEHLAAQPRNIWTALEETVVSEYESKIQALRIDYANRLLAAWDNFVNNNNTNGWGFSQLFENITADGFEWPPMYLFSTSQQQELIDAFAAAAAAFGETNQNIPTGIGATFIGAGAGISVATTAIALNFFMAESTGVATAAYGAMMGSGPVITVAAFAACVIAVKAMEVADVQNLINDIQTEMSANYGQVFINQIVNAPNRVQLVKLYNDLDYIMGAPVTNGFQYNYSDNLEVEPFSIMAFANTEIPLGANGTVVVAPEQVATVFSACNSMPETFSLSQSEFDCSDLGLQQIQYTATSSDFSITVTVTVNIVDHFAPSVNCKPHTLLLNASGNMVLNAADVFQSGTDNCGTVNPTGVSNTAFNCAHLGANTVVLTAADTYGNTATCSAVVTVADQLAPTVVCKNKMISLNSAGSAAITTGDVFQSGADNCGAVNQQSVLPNTFNCAQIGVNTVTLTVNDGHGNTASCNASVTVTDQLAPTVVCKNKTLLLNSAGSAAITTGDVFQSGADNCGAVNQQSVLPNTFNCAQIGVSTATLTVNDGHGNTASCNATITVTDQLAPTVVCKNKTVYLNSAGAALVVTADVFQSGADNCGAVNQQSVLPNAFTCAQLGANTVTLTVNDGHGNTATCNASVTVADNTSPTMQCKNLTVALGANGTVNLTPAQVNNGSYDNCSIAAMNLSKSVFSCADLGVNNISLDGIDQSSNKGFCLSTITIVDINPPVALCKNTTVQLNANGSLTLAPAAVNNGSYDQCTISNITATPNTFSCAHVGNNSVTLSVTDQSGNISSCQSIVKVLDLTAPTALCKNPTIYLDGTGQANLSVAQVNNGSTDACGIAVMTINKSNFNCGDIAAPVSVLLTVKDLYNNVSSCQSQVTVKDNSAPTAFCENTTVHLGPQGYVVVPTAPLADGSYDNCAVWSYFPAGKVYTSANLGVNSLSINVKDWSNNTATCVSQVTVLPYANSMPSDEGGTTGTVKATPVQEGEMTVFPNPTAGNTVLQFRLDNSEALHLNISNLAGETVKTLEFEGESGENLREFDMSGLPAGVYFLDLRKGSGRIGTKRVVVAQE